MSEARRKPEGDRHDRTPEPCRHRRSGPRGRRGAIPRHAGREGRPAAGRTRPRRDGHLHRAAEHQGRTALPAGEDSPIAGFLEKNPSGGIHHICYEVEDILAARDQLKASGARVLGSGEPKIGAHGKPVLFLHPKDFTGTLVELEQV
jgi:catechol 2,3-dioxygenase-like lactoylglutathione lyase family enzyme